MKNIAVIYSSVHHGNTEKLLRSVEGLTLIPALEADSAPLESFDLVGLASGVYMSRLHSTLTDAIARNRSRLNRVFVVYTNGANNHGYGQKYRAALEEMGLSVAGVFDCRGFDTFGPFKLVGGIAKGHPNEKDFADFRRFIEQL